MAEKKRRIYEYRVAVTFN